MPRSILVLGATGVSGLAFIREAESQHEPPKLTLYVRSTAKLPEDAQAKHRVVVGGLDDEKALNEAMEGVDAVVSLLGAYMSFVKFLSRDTSTPIADSFPTIMRVMKAHGVKRILALSTAAFKVPQEQPGWSHYFAGLMTTIVVPQGNAEMKRIGEVVSADDELEWTVFRVPHLNEGAADLPVCAGLLGSEWQGTLELSRASQARWILKEIEEGKWIRQAPCIANY